MGQTYNSWVWLPHYTVDVCLDIDKACMSFKCWSLLVWFLQMRCLMRVSERNQQCEAIVRPLKRTILRQANCATKGRQKLKLILITWSSFDTWNACRPYRHCCMVWHWQHWDSPLAGRCWNQESALYDPWIEPWLGQSRPQYWPLSHYWNKNLVKMRSNCMKRPCAAEMRIRAHLNCHWHLRLFITTLHSCWSLSDVQFVTNSYCNCRNVGLLPKGDIHGLLSTWLDSARTGRFW